MQQQHWQKRKSPPNLRSRIVRRLRRVWLSNWIVVLLVAMLVCGLAIYSSDKTLADVLIRTGAAIAISWSATRTAQYQRERARNKRKGKTHEYGRVHAWASDHPTTLFVSGFVGVAALVVLLRTL